MTTIDPTGAASQGAAPAQAAATSALNQLDNSQTFLDLLVAQLKNQNPDNPTNPTQFMTEIAQLTAVQSQTTLNAEEQTVAADSMIGRQVDGTGAAGAKVSGVVTSVLLSSSGVPTLQIGSGTSAQDLPLDAVQQVSLAPTSGSSASTSPTGGGTAGTSSGSSSGSTTAA